jgi:hypothetical protein
VASLDKSLPVAVSARAKMRATQKQDLQARREIAAVREYMNRGLVQAASLQQQFQQSAETTRRLEATYHAGHQRLQAEHLQATVDHYKTLAAQTLDQQLEKAGLEPKSDDSQASSSSEAISPATGQLHPSRYRARLSAKDYQHVVNLSLASGHVTSTRLSSLTGLKPSTIRGILGRHARGELQTTSAPPCKRRGPKVKISQDLLFAAARYLQLFPDRTVAQAHEFLKTHLTTVNCHPKTLARHLREEVGLRVSDFKHVPPRRNDPYAIEARYKYCSQGLEM